MKKIIIAILLFIAIIFAINSGKHENIMNETKNIAPQNEFQVQNEVSNAERVNEVQKNLKENVLEGKTIAFIGDSLVEGYGNEFHGFDYYLAKQLPNTNFINNSKSGSTITDNSGTDNIIMLNQAKTLIGTPDIIVFDGGANDIMGYSLGFLNQDLKKEIGTVDLNSNTISNGETVISDLEAVVLELKNKFPNAKLCYLQPFLLDEETISHLTQDETAKQEIATRRDAFFQEVPKMCTKWNIEYLDVSNHFAGTRTTYRQEDWIHIKEAGYELLTPYILQKLKEM